MFLAGFFIWNMDNIFCRHLTAGKNQIMLPWSAILEGHGWWHILTGLGKSTPMLHLGDYAWTMLTWKQAVCETSAPRSDSDDDWLTYLMQRIT